MRGLGREARAPDPATGGRRVVEYTSGQEVAPPACFRNAPDVSRRSAEGGTPFARGGLGDTPQKTFLFFSFGVGSLEPLFVDVADEF